MDDELNEQAQESSVCENQTQDETSESGVGVQNKTTTPKQEKLKKVTFSVFKN